MIRPGSAVHRVRWDTWGKALTQYWALCGLQKKPCQFWFSLPGLSWLGPINLQAVGAARLGKQERNFKILAERELWRLWEELVESESQLALMETGKDQKLEWDAPIPGSQASYRNGKSFSDLWDPAWGNQILLEVFSRRHSRVLRQ